MYLSFHKWNLLYSNDTINSAHFSSNQLYHIKQKEYKYLKKENWVVLCLMEM